MRNHLYSRSASRVIGARAIFRNTLPVFEEDSIDDSAISGYTSYDADVYSSGILRVAVVGGFLAYQYISDIDSPPAWTISAVSVDADTYIGVRQNRIWFRQSGSICYCDYSGSLGGATPVTALSGKIALAPVAAAAAYVCAYETDNIKKVGYVTTSIEWWSGRIYGQPTPIYPFDAERFGVWPLIDYVVTGEEDNKRAMQLSRYKTWSDAKYVFPLDIVDDTSYYQMGSVSQINGKFVVVAKVKRSNGPTMLTYSFGPDRYSAGREMFIDEVSADFEPIGKLHQIGAEIVYLGPDVLYRSDATLVFGYDNPSLKFDTCDISAAHLRFAQDGASIDSLVMPAGLDTRAGQHLEVYEIVDGTEYMLGTFDVDARSEDLLQDGETRDLGAGGMATKRLAQWQSDTSFDYWSQAKQISTPADRGELARVSGMWDWQPTELTPTRLNQPGYIQFMARASRDGIARCKFNRVDGTYHAYYGVGLQFYRLSIYEIAEILGKDIGDVTEEEADSTGANGILALYGTDLGVTGAGVTLYKIRDGEMTALASADLSIPVSTDHWLMISSHDGYIRVDYRLDSSTSWTSVLTYTYDDDDGVWVAGDLMDKIGRGFFYMENVTPHQDCYPFQSTDELIPLKGSHAVFPGDGEVQVDDERITYSDKSSNDTHYGPYEYVGPQLIASMEEVDGSEQVFSDSRSRNAIRQSISESDFYVRSIHVYVADVNSPDDGMKLCVYTGPVAKETPAGRLVSSQTVPASDITSSFGWVSANFPLGTKMSNGDWIMLYRENNPTHPDDSDWFKTLIKSVYANGQAATFNEDYDKWTTLSGDIPFKIYGVPLSSGNVYGVEIVGGPNVAVDALDDCALVVTSGTGKNASFRIVSYTYGSPNSIVYVDEDPSNILGGDSYVVIAPTLIIDKRGCSETIKTSHGNTVCSIYSAPQVVLKGAEFFSTDIDMTLGDVAKELCAKAGAVCNIRTELSTLYVPNDYSKYVDRRYCIGEMQGSFSTEAGMFFGYDDTDDTHILVTLTSTQVKLYHYDGAFYTLREAYTTGLTHNGICRFSYFEDSVSVWLSGRLLYSFAITDALTGYRAGFYSPSGAFISSFVEETDIRVDNFIFDMGRSGMQLLSNLIGEKKIYFRDDYDGDLSIFVSNYDMMETINLGYRCGTAHANSALVTRIRVEGGDVYEAIDAEAMKLYGNVFRLLNSRESYDMYDTQRFAEDAIDKARGRLYYMMFADVNSRT